MDYFNSTMVRLKVPVELLARVERKFQFHYGTIKRRQRIGSSYFGKRISIPLWYD